MPVELSFAERRVLGVLIEKGFTTPEQYPLTLNGVIVGCNQKSCRDPVSSLDERSVLESLDSLRRKGFVILVRTEGSRADRWKHRTGECLSLQPREVAVLGELLLRGPQTDGEIRQRASRMVPLGELPELVAIIEALMSRDEPLVRRLSSPEKRRGAKFAHTLYPPSEAPAAGTGAFSDEEDTSFEPLMAAARESSPVAREPASAEPLAPTPHSAIPLTPAISHEGPGGEGIQELQKRLRALEERVEELEATFVRFFR